MTQHAAPSTLPSICLGQQSQPRWAGLGEELPQPMSQANRAGACKPATTVRWDDAKTKCLEACPQQDEALGCC